MNSAFECIFLDLWRFINVLLLLLFVIIIIIIYNVIRKKYCTSFVGLFPRERLSYVGVDAIFNQITN